MTTQVLKVILAGILGGVALFLMPFIFLRVVVFFLIIGAIFRLVRGPRYWRGRYAFWGNPELNRRWNSMTREERQTFKDKMEKELFTSSPQPSTTNL